MEILTQVIVDNLAFPSTMPFDCRFEILHGLFDGHLSARCGGIPYRFLIIDLPALLDIQLIWIKLILVSLIQNLNENREVAKSVPILGVKLFVFEDA